MNGLRVALFFVLLLFLGACSQESTGTISGTSASADNEGGESTAISTEAAQSTATATALPPTVTRPPTPAGFTTFQLPFWVQLDIPDTWHQIRTRDGRLAFSTRNQDFPYFELTAGSALLLLFDVGETTDSPETVLEEYYLRRLPPNRDIVAPVEATVVNGQQAATAAYTNPEAAGLALEQITLLAGPGHMLGVLAITLEYDAADYTDTFEQIVQSITVLAYYPAPELNARGEAPADYKAHTIDWQGITVYYPPDWEVDAGPDSELNLSQPRTARMLTLALTFPEEMETFIDPVGPSPTVAALDVLFSWLASPLDVLQPVSTITTTGLQPERSAVVVAGTYEGEQIHGVLAAARSGDRVLAITAYVDDLDALDDVIEIVSYIELEDSKPSQSP